MVRVTSWKARGRGFDSRRRHTLSIWNFRYRNVVHIPAKTIQMKSSMTFFQSNGWTEIDLILKQIWRRFIWRQVSFNMYMYIGFIKCFHTHLRECNKRSIMEKWKRTIRITCTWSWPFKHRYKEIRQHSVTEKRCYFSSVVLEHTYQAIFDYHTIFDISCPHIYFFISQINSCYYVWFHTNSSLKV